MNWKVIREIFRKSQFKKDFKRILKQGKRLDELKAILKLLVAGKEIPEKYKDHQLTGNWKEFRELHIQPDWLLVYKIENDVLTLIRTGSHSELFG
jgi:mRNA interferase YafQ